MAIVYQLVRDHNGKIMVESETGRGTSISIRLPASGRVTRDPEGDSSSSGGVARAGSSTPVTYANSVN